MHILHQSTFYITYFIAEAWKFVKFHDKPGTCWDNSRDIIFARMLFNLNEIFRFNDIMSTCLNHVGNAGLN